MRAQTGERMTGPADALRPDPAGTGRELRVADGHPSTARLSEEAQRLLNYAAWIGAHQTAAAGQLSFLSPLIALLSSPDPASRAVQAVAARRRLTAETLAEVPARQLAEWRRRSAEALPDTEKSVFTISAEELLVRAARYADELSGFGRRVEIRHVVAAYVYEPPHLGHAGEVERLGLDPEGTSRALVQLVEERQPDEAAAWRRRHERDFGATLSPNPSARIVRDYWTAVDALGYGVYARALELFLTHPHTREPLCVSIQAPWGAGKTSLMRMIQARLDPRATRIAEARGRRRGRRVRPGATTGAALGILDERGPASLPKAWSRGAKRFTVWFNAWKYQSSEQLWAGLIDAIITQVTERMPRAQRELMLLRLNVARIDREAVRRRVHERVATVTGSLLRTWGSHLHGVLAGSGVGAVGSALAGGSSGGLAASGIGGALVGAAVSLVRARRRASGDVEKEPATFNFGDLIRVPDYRAKAGFIHEAAADLELVLSTIPREYLPLVIFVDDLDRCSPDRVASVVEGVNLFLAGEFPNCLFVIGMDPQLVAAALDEAQSKIVDRLPEYDRGTAVGWRFMDKFVQLPFTLPPPDDADLEHFSDTLATGAEEPAAATRAGRPPSTGPAADAGSDVARRLGAFRARAEELEERQGRYARSYSDDNPDARRALNRIATQFSRNPREIKRLTNVVRLASLMRFAREARGLAIPTDRQYEDWVVLSLKWPDFVRWVSWPASSGDSDGASPRRQMHDHLAALETAARDLPDFATWRRAVAAYLGFEPDAVPWLAYPELHRFLARQAARPEDERLSAAAAIGFY